MWCRSACPCLHTLPRNHWLSVFPAVNVGKKQEVFGSSLWLQLYVAPPLRYAPSSCSLQLKMDDMNYVGGKWWQEIARRLLHQRQ